MRGLLFLLFAGVASFGASRLLLSEREPLAPKSAPFSPNPHPLQKRPFLLLFYALNSGPYLEKTLHSIARQDYPTYRLLYIDDASDDGSFALAEELLQKNPFPAQLIRHDERQGLFATLAEAASTAREGEILVLFSGGQRLAHEWALETLNRYYDHPHLLATLASGVVSPSYKKEESALISLDPHLCRHPAFQEAAVSLAEWLQEKIPSHLGHLSEVLALREEPDAP